MVQSSTLCQADRLMDPEPSMLLLDHRWIVVAHQEKCLYSRNIIGLIVKFIQVL